MNIYDIAKLAGVSHMTVSRVINNKPGVKAETKERILNILDEHGYLPNSFARGLANNEMRLIGIIVIDVRNIHHNDIAYHIEEAFSKLGYSSIIGGCGTVSHKQEEYLRMMAGRNVDGLVLIGSRFQNETTKNFIEKYFNNKPVVMANGYLELENVCGILLNERKAVSNVVDQFVHNGHKEIAFINELVTVSARNKQDGFLEAIEKNQINFNKSNIRYTQTDIFASMKVTKDLLQENTKITALIYSEDLMAVGGVKACHELGLRVPEDINVIGFNNSIYSDASSPTISSIDNRIVDMGDKCTAVLYKMLCGEKMKPIVDLMPMVVAKESTNYQM